MMPVSISKKLMISVGFAIFVLLSISSFYSYQKTRDNVQQAIEQQIQLTGEKTSAYVSSWIRNKAQILRGTAQALENGDRDNVIVHGQVAGDFLFLYLGTKQGEMYMHPDDPLPSDYDPRKRPWYEMAIRENRLVLTAPYLDATTNETIITFALPTKDGVLGGDVALTDVIKQVLNINLGSSGYAALLDKNQNFMVVSDSKRLGKPIQSYLNSNQRLATGRITRTSFEQQDSLLGLYAIPNSDWQLLLVMNTDDAFARLASLRWGSIIITLLTILIVTTITGVLIDRLLRPLRDLSQAMSNIAQGDANLTKRLTVQHDDEIGVLSRSFNTFVESIHTLVSQSKQSSVELDNLSQQASQNAEMNNDAVHIQQQEISQVAVAVNELSSTASEVATNASDTAQAANRAHDEGTKGMDVAGENKRRMTGLTDEIDRATHVINELDEQAQQITSILATIQGIAEQTNLLALNAAIEAARAGEQGRGFAVVADEVRTLSQRTHTATGEIQDMIDGLKKHSQNAVSIMSNSKKLTAETAESADEVTVSLNAIASALTDISDRSNNIANASREQHAATEEISRIATAIQAASDDLARNIDAAKHQSSRLHTLSSDISGGLARFKV
ncbi:MAG: methyl-accepting chemotaxis protein [Bacterioplanes sp.]|nr:methyl-accepting chemotaxis protein [Bacterioplanes sp.]